MKNSNEMANLVLSMRNEDKRNVLCIEPGNITKSISAGFTLWVRWKAIFFLRHFVFRSNISFGNGLAFTQNYLSKWESQKQNNQFSSWIDEIRKRKAPVWVVVSCWLGRFSIRVCSDKWTFFSSSSVEVFFFFLCCVFVIVVRCEIVWENEHWFELLPSNMYLKLYYLDEKKTTAMVLKKQEEKYQQQKK